MYLIIIMISIIMIILITMLAMIRMLMLKNICRMLRWGQMKTRMTLIMIWNYNDHDHTNTDVHDTNYDDHDDNDNDDDRPCMIQRWEIIKTMIKEFIKMIKIIKKMIKIMIHLSDRPCMMQRWVRKLKKFAKTGCMKYIFNNLIYFLILYKIWYIFQRTGCMEYIFNNLIYFKRSDIFFKRSAARNIFWKNQKYLWNNRLHRIYF